MTAAASFKQADVTRLIRGAVKAGFEKDAIRLTVAPDGSLSITVQRPDTNDNDADEWSEA